MTKIKICGLVTVKDAQAVNQARPDFAGVVFAAGRHQVNAEEAALIRQKLDKAIPLVGVFTDQPVEQMLSLYREKIIQLVQLHSPKTAEELQKLRSADVPVILVSVGDEQIKIMNKNKQNVSDYQLVDAGQGSGRSLDWTTLPDLTKGKTFLAGGLNVVNLQTAINQVQPYGVDLSSGSEQNGRKNLKLMQELVAIAHGNGEKK